VAVRRRGRSEPFGAPGASRRRPGPASAPSPACPRHARRFSAARCASAPP
jgi:hypothetical protein